MADNNKIFPSEIVRYTAERHFQQHNTRTVIIYKVVLACMVLAFCSLWLIKVEISVKSGGIFRAETDRNIVKASVSGAVDSVYIRENMYVNAGQVLMTIESDILEEQTELIDMRQEDIRRQVADLQQLVKLAGSGNVKLSSRLSTGLYRQQYSLFKQRVYEADARFKAVKRQYDRYKYLFDNKVISAGEFDKISFEYEHARNARNLVFEQQGSQWQAALNDLTFLVQEIVAQQQQYGEEAELYTVRAGLSGTIQQFNGIRPGNYVGSGEVIAEISPDSGLIAEAYVLPDDIGLLKIGTPVRLQVAAYNYHQWGMGTGNVISISKDIYRENGGQPYFLVKCELDQDHLELKNGYAGEFKKGMTFQARFFVIERTLFQLLYDKADDWLNPNLNPDQSQAHL